MRLTTGAGKISGGSLENHIYDMQASRKESYGF